MSGRRLIDAYEELTLELAARKNVWYVTTCRHRFYRAFLAEIERRFPSFLLV